MRAFFATLPLMANAATGSLPDPMFGGKDGAEFPADNERWYGSAYADVDAKIADIQAATAAYCTGADCTPKTYADLGAQILAQFRKLDSCLWHGTEEAGKSAWTAKFEGGWILLEVIDWAGGMLWILTEDERGYRAPADEEKGEQSWKWLEIQWYPDGTLEVKPNMMNHFHLEGGVVADGPLAKAAKQIDEAHKEQQTEANKGAEGNQDAAMKQKSEAFQAYLTALVARIAGSQASE